MRIICCAALLALSACGPRPAPAGPPVPAGPPAGTTKLAAIEVCDVRGEYDYLAHLRCAGGAAPTYERDGNVGMRQEPAPGAPEPSFEDVMDPNRRLKPGEADPHIVDLYSVTCTDGRHEVYIDMYHCAQPAPTLAPPGFTFAQ